MLPMRDVKLKSALMPSILLDTIYLKSCSYVDSKSLPIDQSDIFRFFEGFKKVFGNKLPYESLLTKAIKHMKHKVCLLI